MKKLTSTKRLLSLILAVAMLASLASPAMAAESGGVSFTEVDNSSVTAQLSSREPAETPEEESPYDENDVVRVSIFLSKAATIEAGFDTYNIADNDAAMVYRDGLKRDQVSLVQKIEAATSEKLDVVWNLTLAANLISANVKYGQIETIESVPGVRKVVIETQYTPDVVSSGAADPNMATSSEQTGATAAWASGYTGAGSKIAIIDTGLDVEHEAFNAGAFEYSLSLLEGEYDLLDAADIAAVLGDLNLAQLGVTAEDLYVNSKVPFGFNYVDVDLDLSHYNSEHGSHVAGISAANSYVFLGDSYLPSLPTTFAQGVAPDAQLMVMKVFGRNGGAYDADYMAAIEDAIILGADSVNLSLGSAVPGMSYNSDYQDLLNSLVGSGVVVTISAGNSGSWVDSSENGMPYLYLDDVSMHTGGSPGTYTNSLGVASVDNAGFTGNYLTVGDSMVSYAETYDSSNTPMVNIADNYEYVLVNGIGTPEEFAAIGEDVLSGKIVMCYRGTTSFFEKANAAAAMGAAGVIIVNNQPGVIYLNLSGYNYTIPVVSITQGDGELFKQNGTVVTAEDGSDWYWTGNMEVSPYFGAGMYNSEYYTMSSFSSWGIPGSLEMKPEITAPGGNIFSVAGDVPGYISGHNSYELMSGTSMAAPQVAGMAAVLAQYIRETGLEEQTGLDARTLAQSLLMSTAEPILDGNNGGNYYPVLQQGAGLANVGNAIAADSYILMDANATDSYADGKVKVELGDDPDRTGTYTFSFTINNLTDSDQNYVLSADVFTQSAFIDAYGDLYMDTWVTGLNPVVTWTVDGKAVEGSVEMAGLDFNGDELVNAADGQALLDYATGLDVELSNVEYADLDEDGDIDSYDSYLFFSMLAANGAYVPAYGSTTVDVTITLTDSDKAWLSNYPNGAYIEAYVYAEGMSTIEGVEGTSHSIPVLGFYGNWSDPSMFDKGSYQEYANGLETRAPYLYQSAFSRGNYNSLFLTYGDTPSDLYYFGGNPAVSDDQYMPERNAISAANGDMISMVGFTSIRNAGAAYYFVKNTDTDEYLINESVSDDGLYSAYYHVNNGVWSNTYWTLNTGYTPSDVANETNLELGITLIPEYYIDDEGNIDWDALGDGATFSMPMVVDNEAPVLDNMSLAEDASTLTVTASDNQYVAAVVLYDEYGQTIFSYTGSHADAVPEEVLDYELDLTGVAGRVFLLQVIDYAYNTTTYRVELEIGEMTDVIDSVEISETSMVMQAGTTAALQAFVLPTNATNRAVVWTSSNEAVATVDENGLVTAVAEGYATITATSAADETKYASCTVEVINISVDLNGIVWDEEGSIWYSQFNTTGLPNYEKLSGDMVGTDFIHSVTVGPDGILYASSLNPNNGTGALYTIDPATYELTKISDCIVQGLHIFYSDLTYAPAMFGTGALLGTYGPYVIAIDPATGEAYGIIDQFDTDLVGITTCYGMYDPDYGEYQDVVYLIEGNGTVTQEIYYGYDGIVVPYMYYFYGERASMDSGVNKGSAWYYNSAYYDGEYLYWAAHEPDVDNNVTLYAIDADYSGNVYELGSFANDVWPVSGLHEQSSTPYSMSAAEGMDEIRAMVAEKGMPEAQEYQLVTKEFVTETQAAGGLDSVANYEAPAEPMSNSEDAVVVNVTAKDATGSDVDSTNGVATVNYDPEKLELLYVEVMGDYVSFDITEGSVTFGYVALDGIAAEDSVATLVFKVKNPVTEDISVSILHEQTNNDHPDYEEILNLVTAPETPDVEWIGASLSLKGDIGLNFYAQLSDKILADETAYVLFSVNGEIATVPLDEGVYDESDGSYGYRMNLNAKNMGDKVTAQVLTDDGTVRDSATLSIKGYADYAIANSPKETLVNLMKAMLNYGAAAQVEFGYDVENLVNADLPEADKALPESVDVSAYASSLTGAEEGITVSSASLVLQSEAKIRVYFTLAEGKSIDDYTFTVAGQEVTPVASGNEYYIEKTNVTAKDLDTMYTFQMGGLTLNYCGLSYVNIVQRDYADDVDLMNLAKALYFYNQAANAYFG